MQRYSVTIVSPGTAGERPVLLVPFQPTAIVKAFVDELWKRIARQGLRLEPNTHIATLHLDSETGGVIDFEDVLSDVVTDPKNEKLFAVFANKANSFVLHENKVTSPAQVNGVLDGDEVISIRVITPELARDKASCPVLSVPIKSTLMELHNHVAKQLQIQAKFQDDAEVLECNCKLANMLADGPGTPGYFLLVHSKSEVERLPLRNPTESALKEALRERFGVDFEEKKKVFLAGAEVHIENPSLYKKAPVVATCSKQRHAPAHARFDVNDTGLGKTKVLDLHTTEAPIHPGCMSSTIKDAGLRALAVDGTVDIYVVNRTTTGNNSSAAGKSSIYRSQACWEPRIVQSERGRAMFLSSLRVFASLVQDMRDEERLQDAVLHVIDLLTKFPPATRGFYLLASDKTPTAADCAAISHAMFEILDAFMPTDIIGTDHSRVFEGARLLFGFILEKGRTLKLPDEEGATLPYLTSYQTIDFRDFRTNEAVKKAVQTPNGLVETSLFNAFQEEGILVHSHLQTFMTKIDVDLGKYRQALLAGGAASEIVVFSPSQLSGNYRYRDSGNVIGAFDIQEISELGHLAELCGRNKLAVYRPSQLASAVAPCLTFDRNAHLAVYTGEQPCGNPGQSSIVFRPLHGEETINTAVVEQLIAQTLKKYSDDGTAVFDALGGAAVRRLQAPDEILYFVVDTSASMRKASDFADINDDEPPVSEDSNAASLVDSEFYNSASLDDMKEQLCSYEGFQDMIAIIGEAFHDDRRFVAFDVLEILRTMLSSDIIRKSKELESRQQHARGWYYARQQATRLEAEVNKLKGLWAGLKTHEDAVCDFLIYRATTASNEINQRWTWSLGDSIPAMTPPQHIPTLDADITDLPFHLRCPISQMPMPDAVTAADGFTYSHSAIQKWFNIRSSSPMTGLPLDDTTLNANQEICDAAALWIDGGGIPGRTGGESKRLRSSNELEITFDSKVGSFQRYISSTMTLKDLYKLAFRGLKAKFVTFQIYSERTGPLIPSSATKVSSCGFANGDRLTIRIPDDDPVSNVSGNVNGRHSEVVLVKVYEHVNDMLFAYWVKKDTISTLSSVLWKYWRWNFAEDGFVSPSEKQVWTDMKHSGDNLLSGSPQNNSDKLATFLSRGHCFGILGTEKVYREGPGNNGIDGPLVLKVSIGEAWEQRTPDTRLTRLDVLKQMFEALVNRVLAYNYKTHFGLITFASTCQVAMGVSHVLENFRRATSNMNASGDTALWDALALASDQLDEYGKKYPEAKKRIICISDGADTKSTNKPEEICWRLQQSAIAMDTVSLGNEMNEILRTIPTMLGCYRFHPTSLVNALAITEMEPFLSLSERPPISPLQGIPKNRLQYMGYFWNARRLAKATVVTNETVPPRKEHPNLDDDFVELAAAAANGRPGSSTGPTSNARSNLRITRLLNEMRQIANRDHPTYDVYVSERDMSFWKVVLSGPGESPYQDGVFLIYLHADEGYPTFAPKARFVTKIKHPNVNMHGRICHSIFDRDWTSDTSMATLIDTIYGLLYQPEYSDPVNTTTTLGYHHDQVEFADEVREHVSRYAKKSRAELKKEVLGDDDSSEDGEEMDE